MGTTPFRYFIKLIKSTYLSLGIDGTSLHHDSHDEHASALQLQGRGTLSEGWEVKHVDAHTEPARLGSTKQLCINESSQG